MVDSIIEVREVLRADDEALADLHALVSQLSSRQIAVDLERFGRIVSSESTTLFVAADGPRLVGMLTLAVFEIPTGIRAWIEDVVVDKQIRGRGIGRLLLESAIQKAALEGAKTVDLTSRPSRVEARRMYESAGFVQRDSAIFRLSL